MARKAVKRAKRAVKAPGGYTTLPIGEEGIPRVQEAMTTLMLGEEGGHHPTTLIAGEEQIFTTMVYGEEHPIPSIPLAEHPPSDLTNELGPIFHPGDPVEQQAALAAKKTAARKRRT